MTATKTTKTTKTTKNYRVCWDTNTNVWYPSHEEKVVQVGPRMIGKGYCVRCGEKC